MNEKHRKNSGDSDSNEIGWDQVVAIHIALIAFKRIEDCFEQLRKEFPNAEFEFCWDECMWVNEEFFDARQNLNSDFLRTE